MGLPARCTRSSPTTSPQGPPWSPTDGPVTWASTRSATPMIGAVNAPPRPWARTSASCCRECTASRPWPNGGCFPPTTARCTSSTCLVTWTSSASGSTVAAHAAAVWSSTGCSNWPSATTQSVTSSSLRAPSRRRSGRPLPETEATRLAWTAPAPDDPGATRPDEAKSAQMDSPESANTPPDQLTAIVSAFACWHARQFRTARIVQYEFPQLTAEHREEVLTLRKQIDAVVKDVLQAGVASGDFDVPDLAMTTLALQSLTIDVARWYKPGIRRTPEAIGTAYGNLALRLVRA